MGHVGPLAVLIPLSRTGTFDTAWPFSPPHVPRCSLRTAGFTASQPALRGIPLAGGRTQPLAAETDGLLQLCPGDPVESDEYALHQWVLYGPVGMVQSTERLRNGQTKPYPKHMSWRCSPTQPALELLKLRGLGAAFSGC